MTFGIWQMSRKNEYSECLEKGNNYGKNIGLGCLALFIFFFILAMLTPNSSDNTNTSFEDKASSQKSMVKYACQEAIKNRLNNPADAKFPNITKYSFDNMGDMDYITSSYVDTIDSSGVTTRDNFSCEVQIIDKDTTKVKRVYVRNQ